MYKYQCNILPKSASQLVMIDNSMKDGSNWSANKTPFKDSVIMKFLEELKFPSWAYGEIVEVLSEFGNPAGMFLSLIIHITSKIKIEGMKLYEV